MAGMNIVTNERILRNVANDAHARTTSFDVVGQNPLSRIVRVVCDLMVLSRLQVTDPARMVCASQVFPSSKIPSSPPVVGVSVLLRRRRRIVTVTCTITSNPKTRLLVLVLQSKPFYSSFRKQSKETWTMDNKKLLRFVYKPSSIL